MEAARQSGWIALGAGLGANLRYWFGAWIAAISGGTWPLGTLVINVTGSALLGLVVGMSDRFQWSHDSRLLWAVGLAGGYTTFSTFSKESIELIQAGRWLPAVGYVAASVVASLGAFAFALWVSSR